MCTCVVLRRVGSVRELHRLSFNQYYPEQLRKCVLCDARQQGLDCERLRDQLPGAGLC
jgi:hypothetical protein